MECPNCHMIIKTKKCSECGYEIIDDKEKLEKARKLDWVRQIAKNTKKEDLALLIFNAILTVLLNLWNTYKLLEHTHKFILSMILASLFLILFIFTLLNAIFKKKYDIIIYEDHVIVGYLLGGEYIITIDNKEIKKVEKTRKTKEIIAKLPYKDVNVKLTNNKKIKLEIM